MTSQYRGPGLKLWLFMKCQTRRQIPKRFMEPETTVRKPPRIKFTHLTEKNIKSISGETASLLFWLFKSICCHYTDILYPWLIISFFGDREKDYFALHVFMTMGLNAGLVLDWVIFILVSLKLAAECRPAIAF